MAKFDQGGGCACGLHKVCVCKPAPQNVNGGLSKAVAAIGPDRDVFVPAPFDPASIKPAHGEMGGTGKFSPNLYRWMVRWVDRYHHSPAMTHPQVYRDGDGGLWIGRKRMDDNGWFTGARLMRVLCNGAKQEIYAMAPATAADLKPLPNFWRAYRRIGRCAIDPKHETYWSEDGARWLVKGKRRSCKWCGNFHQRLVTKTKIERTVVKNWVTT